MTRDAVESTARSSFSVSIRAPAKVNLILRILDRRPDGYHNVWSVMQTVGLDDDVSIRLERAHSEIRLHCSAQFLGADQTNLVYRAAAAVLERSNIKIGLDIVLAKHIPMGAGLGGGSSDAAATIFALNHLLKLEWSVRDMMQVGEELGSDVPFFFSAPSAIVTGRGEQVNSLEVSGSRWIVLINPGFSIETKWAYRQLSESRRQVKPLSSDHCRLETAGHVTWEQILSMAENDFEIPVFEAYPLLREIKMQLLKQKAETALLSGSGATVFGVFVDEVKARQAVAHFSANGQCKVFLVPTGAHLSVEL